MPAPAPTTPERNPYLGIGLYSIPEAARIIHARPQSVRRWATGYTFDYQGETRTSQPLFDRSDPKLVELEILTFVDLVELALIGRLRAKKISMPTIRAAADLVRREFQTGHPLASARFLTDGKRLVIESARAGDLPHGVLRELPNLQTVMEPIARPLFEELEFGEDRLAEKYWPLGKNRQVVIDPRRQFGTPIIHRYGVPTWVLADMVRGGESVERVAKWYEVSPEAVREAVAYESTLKPQ